MNQKGINLKCEKRKLQKKFSNIIDRYGTEENKKKLKKDIWMAIVLMAIVVVITRICLPDIIFGYFLCLAITMVINFICTYFFMKKENSNKYKKIKVIIFMISLGIFFLVMSPTLLVIGFVSWVARATDKVYLWERNISCFLMEISYHMVIVCVAISQTLKHSENVSLLFLVYFVTIIVGKTVSAFFRWIFIQDKYKHYERYRYKKELNDINEYMYLGAAALSIIFGGSEYENLFIPILLLYALKQITRYREERKNSNFEKKLLKELLSQLQELDEMYLEIIEGTFCVSNYVDESKVNYYRLYNAKKTTKMSFGRKRRENVYKLVENIAVKVYSLPEEKEQARNDLHNVLNSIVKCI